MTASRSCQGVGTRTTVEGIRAAAGSSVQSHAIRTGAAVDRQIRIKARVESVHRDGTAIIGSVHRQRYRRVGERGVLERRPSDLALTICRRVGQRWCIRPTGQVGQVKDKIVDRAEVQQDRLKSVISDHTAVKINLSAVSISECLCHRPERTANDVQRITWACALATAVECYTTGRDRIPAAEVDDQRVVFIATIDRDPARNVGQSRLINIARTEPHDHIIAAADECEGIVVRRAGDGVDRVRAILSRGRFDVTVYDVRAVRADGVVAIAWCRYIKCK